MMSQFLSPGEARRGSALLTLMLIVLVVCVGVSGMVGYAKQQGLFMGKSRNYLKAQAYAEAGANEAYAICKTNWAARLDPLNFPAKAFEDGVYNAEIVSVSSNQASIICTGIVGAAVSVVMLDIKNFGTATAGSTNPPPAGAYVNMMCAGGKMNWSGSGTLNVGAGGIHANGQNKFTGSKQVSAGNFTSSTKIWLTGSTKITVSGTAQAPAITAGSGAIVGTKVVGAVPNQTVPDIDLTPYYNYALANGQVYNSSQHFTGSTTVQPAGGVMWVNGDLQVSGSGGMIGCFIATGDIKVSTSGNHTKHQNLPAFMTRDGDIDYSGSGNINGLVYAKVGGIDISGSGQIKGSLICNGDFDISGSQDVWIYENSTPPADGPGTPGSSADKVGVTAWQK